MPRIHGGQQSMVLSRLRKSLENKVQDVEINAVPAILIVEDDVDQLDLLVSLAVGEIKSLLKDKNTRSYQRKMLTPVNILKVSEMISLEQAVISNSNVIVAVLDCNIPDAKGGAPHDQFVKKDEHIITGQHKSVDLISRHLPGTPTLLVSSMRRFQRTITQYYKDGDDLKLEFVAKDDVVKIQEKIRNSLKSYVTEKQ